MSFLRTIVVIWLVFIVAELLIGTVRILLLKGGLVPHWISLLMDLITNGAVQWKRLPEPMDVAIFPEFRFPISGDRQQYQTALIERFPSEAPAIHRYFRDLDQVYHRSYPAHGMKECRTFPIPLLGAIQGLFSRSYVHWTVKDDLDRRFKNPELKAIIASLWGDVGLPPELCTFPISATVMNHYTGGGYYPVGGAGTIADSVQQIVEKNGGKFLLNREVTQILIERDHAVGVKVQRPLSKPSFIEKD